MLTEVRCDKFREKIIKFHSGMNVVLGDSVASNSIGKSTLLMVLDFIFAGNSFLEYNKDVVSELGDHDYYFSFKFIDRNYFFRRGTDKADLIYECNENYKEITPISIEDYRTFLKTKYSLNDIELTFRSITSLFSRIWGKENIDVKHPLHNFKNQPPADSITNAIKLYNKYKTIKALSENIKLKSEEKTTITRAFRGGLITKTTKSQHKNNLSVVSDIENEIEDIKNNLAKYAVNISEITNREIMELKTKKDNLLAEKLSLDSRLSRVQNDLSQNKSIKSKHLSLLIKYFPNVDTNRLEKVEIFHSQITKILRKELQNSERNLEETLRTINLELETLDNKIESRISNIENPNIIVDRVCELSKRHTDASSEIKYFKTDAKLKDDLKEAKKILEKEKTRILDLINNVVNDKIGHYVNDIYNEQRRSPTLNLRLNSYNFTVVEDTGTGKAYSNLILLDLAFFETTDLPFLIHDSVLFKNIQNNAVAKLITLYEKAGKQSFISIDEIEKYGSDAQNRLLKNSVIELNNDKVLYIKDWRK